MTALPGAPRGDAHPRERQAPPAHRRRAGAAREFLAALLLAVLTVAGGAPAAVGAGLPARSTAAATSFAGDLSGARPAVRNLGRTDRTDRTDRTNPRPGPGAHDLLRARVAVEGLRPGPETAPLPEAVAEHPRTPQHLPPPGPGAPLPRPPGLLPPHPVPGCTLAVTPAAADRFRAVLPGVRGPPGEAVHRPRDLSPVPSRIPAAAP
ncbi:hypothetical protein ACFVW8_03605 [Streptomyces sp. NPDC058221]|uniref:hypothetical protein n=1 Tax=Streptomyces sp. NPDC058221 TaxID=3346388 RepID=UPI0036E25877